MTCEHCIFACTAQGTNMSREHFRRALKYATSYGEHVTLGGGEPTLHPRFWEFLGLCLGTRYLSTLVVTNGSITATALALAEMARKGVVSVALSQDDFHDPIDAAVIQAFTKEPGRPRYSYSSDEIPDLREIRTVNTLVRSGRCQEGEEECHCDGYPFVLPDGRVRQCACDDAPIVGHITGQFQPLDVNEDEPWTCHRTLARRRKEQLCLSS